MQPDITMPRPIAVKEYTAILSVDGALPPTVNVLHNTLGTIIWTHDSTGVTLGTLTNQFTLSRTTLIPGQITQSSILVSMEQLDENQILVGTWNTLTETLVDTLYNIPIFIKVYQ